MKHHWGARLGVGVAMLILAFAGIVLSLFRTTGGWEYWKWIAPIYALLALGLSLFVRRDKVILHPLWHEVVHWLGLFVAVLLVVLYVHLGIVSQNMGALFTLTLLAFAVFSAGIYGEKTFLLVGAALGLFALIVAYTAKILLVLVVLVLVIATAALSYMVWHSHKQIQP